MISILQKMFRTNAIAINRPDLGKYLLRLRIVQFSESERSDFVRNRLHCQTNSVREVSDHNTSIVKSSTSNKGKSYE